MVTTEELRVQLNEAFAEFADREGISFDHEDDWRPWWDCFCEGAKVAAKLYEAKE